MRHARDTGSALLVSLTLALALGAPIPAFAASHGGALPPRPPVTAPAANRGRVAIVTRSTAAPQHRTLLPPALCDSGASEKGALHARRDDGRSRRRPPEAITAFVTA